MAAASQKMVIGIVEHTHMQQQRRNIVVAMGDVLDDVDCFWDGNNEIPRVIKLWNMGVPGDIIVTVMLRPKKELKTLLFHLDLKDRINIDRPGGWDGGMARAAKTANDKSSDAQLSLF